MVGTIRHLWRWRWVYLVLGLGGGLAFKWVWDDPQQRLFGLLGRGWRRIWNGSGVPPTLPEEVPEAPSGKISSLDPTTTITPLFSVGSLLRDLPHSLGWGKGSFPHPSRGLPSTSALEGWLQRLPISLAPEGRWGSCWSN